jgi:hypothetical protein
LHLLHLARSSSLIVLHREKKATNYYEVYVSVLIVMIFSVCSSGLAIVAAAVLVITTDQSSILFGQKLYPAAESGQRILMDTKSGLNKNLTTAEIRLIGPVLPILEAYTSQNIDFMLLEHGESILLYQYQSKIPIDEGVLMNLTRLADFDTIQDAMAEANGIKDVMMNNPWGTE